MRGSRSIDTSKAEALAEVKAVVTAADLPTLESETLDFAKLQGNARMQAEALFARDRVLYSGHGVSAVAASSPYIAEDALELIEVDYEVLPAVLNVQDAPRDDAPLLHEEMTTRIRAERFARGDDSGRWWRSNTLVWVVANHASREKFRSADEGSGKGKTPLRLLHLHQASPPGAAR